MNKKVEINEVASFAINEGRLIVFSSNPANEIWRDKLDCTVLVDEKVRKSGFTVFGKYYLFYRIFTEFGEISVYNEKAELVKIIPEGYNLSSSIQLPNGSLCLPNRISRSYWELTPELKLKDFRHFNKFNNCINGRFYLYRSAPNTVARVKFSDSEDHIIWQISIDKRLGLTSSDSTSLWGEPLGYKDYIYFQLERGDIFAINSETSFLEWAISPKIPGVLSIYEDKLYKKNSSLYEICAITGKIEKEKPIVDIVGRKFFATGSIIALKEFIILWSTSYSEVIVVDRRDFSLIDSAKFHSIGIAHSDSVVRWEDNRLYVLDMERTLHIFERDLN